MAKDSKITQDIKNRYLEEYPDGDRTVVTDIIKNSNLCQTDPRKAYLCTHNIAEIIFVIFCAIISGYCSFYTIEEFARSELEWLRQYFPYKNGYPSHDTFRRVISMVKPADLMELLRSLLGEEFTEEELEHAEKQQLALDGKSIRGYYKSTSGRILHSVSAYATQKGISLAQVITHNEQGKEEGEIQATKKLVKMLDLSNKVITGDAGFCNREIAEIVVNEGGDYVFQLKKNQPNMYEAVEDAFKKQVVTNQYTEESKGHGRVEKRIYETLSAPDNLSDIPLFPRQASIIRVNSFRQEKGKEATQEYRYYISTLSSLGVQYTADLIRSHWRIENSLHYVLDVTFKEDESRTRNMVGAENLLLFRRTALSLLNQVKGKNTIPHTQCKVALNREYRSEIINLLH